MSLEYSQATGYSQAPEYSQALASASRDFFAGFPSYGRTIDLLREQEFGRLDEHHHVYLDYTGGGLYPASLVQEHAALLQAAVLGNPHSQNPASLASTHLVEQARADVLRYFRADPDDYLVIFTSNASGALKLLGESYPFAPGGRFVLVADNHNSVHGIREFARRGGAAISYIPLDPQSLRAPDVEPYLKQPTAEGPSLFAFPAQSNFSGVQHPLAWVELARSYGYDVLLDVAAYVPTNRLDLSQASPLRAQARRVQPDFVTISFYKMFGYPTGVGALLARRQALARLRRPWFAGGTVRLVSTKADLHILAPGHEAFEEGTVNYLNLPVISAGLRLLDSIGIETIHDRVVALMSYLLAALQTLCHSNGAPIVHIYGPLDAEQRGATIAFNLVDSEGKHFPYQQIEADASAANISIRAGCFCNPGAGEYSLTHTAEEVRRCVQEAIPGGEEVGPTAAFDLQRFHQCIGDKPTGAVRVSFGLASNFADAYRCLGFLAGFRDRSIGHDFTERGC